MSPAEKMARLALAQAKTRKAGVVLKTNNQLGTVLLLRAIERRAVLSIVGTELIRVHGFTWGVSRARTASEAA